jgi:hypothetical protein
MCWPFRVTLFLWFDKRNKPNLPDFGLVPMQWPVQGDNSRQDIMKSIYVYIYILYYYIYTIYIYTAVFDVYMYIRYITILWYYLKHFGILGELNTWAILGKPPQSAVSSASPVQVPSSLALTVWVPECISRGTPQNRPGTVGTHPLLNYP